MFDIGKLQINNNLGQEIRLQQWQTLIYYSHHGNNDFVYTCHFKGVPSKELGKLRVDVASSQFKIGYWFVLPDC